MPHVSAIRPPWMGVFPVRAARAVADTHSQGNQLLFGEHEEPQQGELPKPQLFVVLQEVPAATAVGIPDPSIPVSTVIPKAEVGEAASSAPPSSQEAVDRAFDVSLFQLDHIPFQTSSGRGAGNALGRADLLNVVESILEPGSLPGGASSRDVDEVMLPVTVLWRGRTTLSKMCPVDIQQALRSDAGTPLSFLRAYGALVEEILMNKVVVQSKNKSTQSLPELVAQKMASELQDLASTQQQKMYKSPADTAGAVVDPLFHMKSEEGDGCERAGPQDGFAAFLRSHGVRSWDSVDSELDPLTSLLRHAYGLVQSNQKSDGKSEPSSTIKRSGSGSFDGSRPSGAPARSVFQEAVTAMRRHRYAFLKHSVGVMSPGAREEEFPGLIFEVKPETIHTTLTSQRASGAALSGMFPSVVTLDVRIAAMGEGRLGRQQGGAVSSYLPFASVHCFLDGNHKRQLSREGLSSTPLHSGLRHPLDGFLKLLCGTFLHHCQLSDELLPSLLESQRLMVSSCFLPLANSALTREAELLATFECILNAKKNKIRELVEFGRRAQGRAEDLERLVVSLQERVRFLEGQHAGGARSDGEEGVAEQASDSAIESNDDDIEMVASPQPAASDPLPLRADSEIPPPPPSPVADEVGLLMAASPQPLSRPQAHTSRPTIGVKRERLITDDDWLPGERSLTTAPDQQHQLPPPSTSQDDLLALLN